MKTTKAKTVSSVKKNSVSRAVLPSEDEIRNKAYEIYTQRLSSGRNGTESDDWNEAIRILRNS